ncbi:MAG: nucleotidyltransferase domain-containing protein [Paludibacter sp.]
MRLTTFEIKAIHTLAQKNFGSNARVFLFGSRVNDDLKGGDIDLFVSCAVETLLTLDRKIGLLVDLKKTIGDRKIDIVLDNASTRSRESFYHSVTSTYIELLP